MKNFAKLALIGFAILGLFYSWGNSGKKQRQVKKKTATVMADEDGKVSLTEKEWKERLTTEEFYVCRQKGTERPFTGKYYKSKERGTYHCVACGNELFSSETKFDSGTGWPSFWKPLDNNRINEKTDTSLGITRTEVLCNRCDSHLGHVFNDGPAPTKLRYCINSVALDLRKKEIKNPKVP